MKVSLQQITLGAANGTINITDAAISNDFKGAIFFGAAPTANSTSTATMTFSIGACDAGGRNTCFSGGAADASASAPTNVYSSQTFAWRYEPTNGDQTSLAFSTTLTNGVTMTQANTAGAQHLVNVLMFAGSDIEFGVGNALIVGGTSNVAITHNLTGVPDCVILLTNTGNSGIYDNRVNGGFLCGFYDGTNSIGFGSTTIGGAATTNVAARAGTADMGHHISQTPADLSTITLSNVGATTLQVNRTDTTTNQIYSVIAWRCTSGAGKAAAAFVDTTPTGTGANVVKSGMGAAPQLWLNLPTRVTSTAFTNDDTTGSWGFCAAVNNAGTTQQGTVAGSFKFGVATSVAKTYTTISQACSTLNSGGTAEFASTVSTWDQGGVTESVSAGAVGAGERIHLLYGITTDTLTGQIIL